MNAVAIAYKKTHCLQTRNRPKTCSNRSWLESSPFELMPKFSFSMVWGFCLDARPCFCMPIPYLFDFSLLRIFEDCIFPIFVLKTLIKGSPCHQKRGLFWDFVVFSTSFWFFCEIWLPLGPWHLAIAHWNLVLALGPCHWHIEIYHRTMANHDWKPKS